LTPQKIYRLRVAPAGSSTTFVGTAGSATVNVAGSLLNRTQRVTGFPFAS
jgi:hypothetical protein